MLLVSGDYDFCDTLADALPDRGFRLDCAYDSRSAAESLQERTYDVVVLDHWPPYLNAIPLARRLQQGFQQPAVVALSSPRTGQSAQAELQASSDLVVQKTDDRDEMLSVLADLADRHSFAAA
jgi:DNA-binding response OmpR family regulator